MERDTVIHLPSGTELSVEAALGDLSRAREILMDGEFDAEACDLEHVGELLVAFLNGDVQ